MSHTIIRTIQEKDLASSMKSGTLPVLATPQMICWMEEAAYEMLELPEGQTSVGILVDVSHLAPSALGKEVRIEAEILERKGKKIRFSVAAYCGEACIGRGVHERAVVNEESFMKKL